MRLRGLPVSICILGSIVLPALAGDGAPKVKDKSKPVRHALEQAYRALEAALEKNDVEAVLALRHPDYSEQDCQGRTFGSEASRSGTRAKAARTRPPIDATFTLGTIEPNGEDEAVVTVHTSYASMQRIDDGKVRKVETITTQDDTWVKMPDGWRLRSVENVRDFAWYVDGKRVEKGMPYDSEAPPYAPR
ncbi:MAG TPA: DUF4440 domain-containing protein [Candidatus Polarisedimenticolaceae bacterium]|nr:DUF4440 domain-containing protein [Candidatus Polarisedimenticolaceae bacterium]